MLAYLNSRNNFYYFEPIIKRAGAKERGLAILIYHIFENKDSLYHVDLPIIPQVNATAMHQRISLTLGVTLSSCVIHAHIEKVIWDQIFDGM